MKVRNEHKLHDYVGRNDQNNNTWFSKSHCLVCISTSKLYVRASNSINRTLNKVFSEYIVFLFNRVLSHFIKQEYILPKFLVCSSLAPELNGTPALLIFYLFVI